MSTVSLPSSRSIYDDPGQLSIVVQGGLFATNIVETATHCRHWRDLFPHAHIVLSLSTTDCLAVEKPGDLSEPLHLVEGLTFDGQVQIAARVLAEACDLITISPGALPLPPLKTVMTTPNNINLQISAAKHGLSKVKTPYVLRIRSDIVFSNRSFLDQYSEDKDYPRGRAAALKQRVLISWMYTLNPYTMERLPLHFSDWFHFGLTDDVRMLWEAPEMTLADSVHYKHTAAHADSNYEERTFLPRLAVEQHIMFHAFKNRIADLQLNFHNDCSSRGLCNEILIDNFTICDIKAAAIVFRKYEAQMEGDWNHIHCVQRTDWIEMALSQSHQRDKVLEDKLNLMTDPTERRFPLEIPSRRMSTKTGFHGKGAIFKRPGDGVVLHGPYLSIPSGHYRAIVQTLSVCGPGTIVLRATLDEGQSPLAERRIRIANNEVPRLDIPFLVPGRLGKKLEIVCETHGIREFAIAGLTILEEERLRPPGPSWLFWPEHDELRTTAGQFIDGQIWTTGAAGMLLFGPYIALPAGRYRVAWHLTNVVELGECVVDVVANASKMVIAKMKVAAIIKNTCAITLDFNLRRSMPGLEFRIRVDHTSDFSFDQILVTAI